MTSAIELLDNPNLDIDPITANLGLAALGKPPKSDELAHFAVGQDDIKNLVLKLQKYNTSGKTPKAAYADIRQVVRDAVIEDSIDKTPTFTITVYDPDWQLLVSGALDGAVDINPGKIPHRWYRLDAFDVDNDEITMTFATRNAVYVSMHKRPVKYSRGKMTRAEAILALLNTVKITKIKFFCPQLHKKQPQAKFRGSSEKKKSEERSTGFTKSDKLTVKGAVASPSQRKVISDVIEAGSDKKMPGLLIVAGVMTVIIESGASNNPQPPNPPYVGAFQQNRGDGWPGTGDAYKDAVGDGSTGQKSGGFYGWALPIYKANPKMTLGQLVATIQGVVGSSNPLNAGYAQKADTFRAEAQHAVNAYGGVDVDDPGSPITTSTDYRKKYEFMVGEPDGRKNENYLGAITRWADEVNWRAYWVRDVLHFMSEEDLFKAKARIRLRRYENGIEGVRMNWDRSKKVSQIILKVRMERWVAPVGTVVIWDEGSSRTGKGRWLVTNIRRSVFDTLGEVTLKKPLPEKKEPAPESGTHTETEDVDFKSGTDLMMDFDGKSPKQIIDQYVLPIAAECGINKTPAQNDIDNHNHTHLGSASDHAGPPTYKWAADIGNGFMTKEEKELTKRLCEAFGIKYSMPILQNSSHDGFRFQIIHGADFGGRTGEHRDHVHFGVRREGPPAGRF